MKTLFKSFAWILVALASYFGVSYFLKTMAPVVTEIVATGGSSLFKPSQKELNASFKREDAKVFFGFDLPEYKVLKYQKYSMPAFNTTIIKIQFENKKSINEMRKKLNSSNLWDKKSEDCWISGITNGDAECTFNLKENIVTVQCTQDTGNSY